MSVRPEISLSSFFTITVLEMTEVTVHNAAANRLALAFTGAALIVALGSKRRTLSDGLLETAWMPSCDKS